MSLVVNKEASVNYFCIATLFSGSEHSLVSVGFLKSIITPRTCSVCSLLTNLAIIGLGRVELELSSF